MTHLSTLAGNLSPRLQNLLLSLIGLVCLSSCAYNLKQKLTYKENLPDTSAYKEKSVKIRVFGFWGKNEDDKYLMGSEELFAQEVKKQSFWKKTIVVGNRYFMRRGLRDIKSYDDLQAELKEEQTDYNLDVHFRKKYKVHWRGFAAIPTLSLIPGHEEFDYDVEMILKTQDQDIVSKSTTTDHYSYDYSLFPYGGTKGTFINDTEIHIYKILIRDAFDKLLKKSL